MINLLNSKMDAILSVSEESLRVPLVPFRSFGFAHDDDRNKTPD
jgi:hypothetical protein